LDTARNGVEALEHAQARHPHVIVTDLVLPRLDGFALCRRLTEEWRTADIRVIALTGISEQTFDRWKKTYGGMQPNDARELRQVREEHAKLKRLAADLSLDQVMLQDVLGEQRGIP